MNERIFTLLQDQNGRSGLNWTEEDKAEFAELIVSECLEIVASSDPGRNQPKKRPTTKILSEPYDKIFDRIHKHFGVE